MTTPDDPGLDEILADLDDDPTRYGLRPRDAFDDLDAVAALDDLDDGRGRPE